MAAAFSFSYDQAFSRNIGWVTPDEQAQLKGKRVAIAGVGGVGGVYLITLARLGVTQFHIADFDTFDIANLNRQAAAFMSTMGLPKADVAARIAKDINPEMEVKIFGQGVDASNMAEFLEGVDLYIDGLDFFAFDARQQIFALCATRGIPATTVAPLGMSAACLNFLPGGMTFEEYFGWGDRPELDKALRFMVGLAPAGLHRPYLVWPEAVNLQERRGPSTIMSVQLCAGVAGTQALKILLGRGRVITAPRGFQYDAYRDKLVHTWRPGGHRNPLTRLALAVGKRIFAKALLKQT